MKIEVWERRYRDYHRDLYIVYLFIFCTSSKDPHGFVLEAGSRADAVSALEYEGP